YTGKPVFSLTVPVTAGWNMIGSLSQPLAVRKIDTANIVSGFFTYLPTGYAVVDTLKPGRAFWVKVRNNGSIVLNSSSSLDGPLPPSSVQPPSAPTPNPPAAPVLSCSNCTTPDAHPSFSWTASSGAVSYKLYRYSCPWSEGDCNGAGLVIYSGSGLAVTDNEVTVFHKTGQQLTSSTTYFYYVKAVDNFDQLSSASNKVNVNSGTGGDPTKQAFNPTLETEPLPTPTETRLIGTLPNPFNPTTIIKYTLAEDAKVSIKVYDLLGREVATLVDEVKSAGYKSVEFDASKLPSGIYFYHMQAGVYTSVKKMVLMK
ncbi:MAG: T9SS type A sorting domain-containing protein, partial [Ignavibacteria bacterium]|nr:T9SS type A sorting domain-containing protein [Ignavibacteria bacterium]